MKCWGTLMQLARFTETCFGARNGMSRAGMILFFRSLCPTYV